MHRPLAVLVAAVFLSPSLHAQPVSDTLHTDSTAVNEPLDWVLDVRSPDGEALHRTAETLTRLTHNPLDVNVASAPELSVIPQVSPSLARRLVKHRKTEGPFSSLNALRAVHGIDRSRLQSMRPYLKIEDTSSSSAHRSLLSVKTLISNFDLEILQRITRDLDLGRGFTADSSQTAFQGSPTRLTTRLRLRHERKFQLALTLDKDPGEALRWQPATAQYGFDHVAGNLAFRDIGRLKTLVVGDYTVQYGQGIALWQGMSFGKGREPVSPLVRSGRGIVSFQSTSENRFFRGVASAVSLTPSLSVSAFFSRRHRDATLDTNSVDGGSPEEPVPARTLSTGGLHRTSSEIRRRDAFGTTTVGGALEYQTETLQVGITGYRSRFVRPLSPPAQPYRRFDLSGTQTSMVSAFGSAFLGDYTLFGEVARASSGPLGGVVGAALDHEAGLQALLLARRFPRSFTSLFGSAIGESGNPQNETGFYTGFKLRIADKWHLRAYVDQYQFPWLRFSVPRPTRGIDTRVVLEYVPRPWLSTYLQVRGEREEGGTERLGPHERQLAAVAFEARQSARWHTEYTFSKALTLRTRVQVSRSSSATTAASYGFLLAQDVHIRLFNNFHLDARLAVFDTDGYASRLYAYEQDLLYSFSVPVLYGQGQRSYILAQYEPISSLSLEAKYGVTWYPHRDVIGSGLNATPGHRSRELRFQARWTLSGE